MNLALNRLQTSADRRQKRGSGHFNTLHCLLNESQGTSPFLCFYTGLAHPASVRDRYGEGLKKVTARLDQGHHVVRTALFIFVDNFNHCGGEGCFFIIFVSN